MLERQALGQRRRRGRGDARALGRGLGVAPARQAYEERVRLRVEDFRALDLRLDDVARAAAVPVAPAHAALGEGLAPQRRDVGAREAVGRVRAELERELASVCRRPTPSFVSLRQLRCRLITKALVDFHTGTWRPRRAALSAAFAKAFVGAAAIVRA